MVGEKSGCIEIIKNYEDVREEQDSALCLSAEKEWNKLKTNHVNSLIYISLDDNEKELLRCDKSMPQSFVEKFIKKLYVYKLIDEEYFLWHKKKPNTMRNLYNDLLKHKLYKAKCHLCGRTFFIDEESFNSVKWKSCGINCLKTTFDDKADYSLNLYSYEENNLMPQIEKNQLAALNSLIVPLTYYGLKSDLKIAYISDIHLEWHLEKYKDNEDLMIRSICNKLYDSIDNANIIIFNGDTADSFDLAMKFYTCFMRKFKYRNFKEWKEDILIDIEDDDIDITEINDRINRLNSYIEKLKKDINLSFDLEAFYGYLKTNCENDSFENKFNKFIKIKNVKKSQEIDLSIIKSKLLKILELKKILNKYAKEKERFEYQKDTSSDKNISDILIYNYEYSYLKDRYIPEIYVTLGNHEYTPFTDINTCVMLYKTKLEKIGIVLLQNNYIIKNGYVIFGGTGFAKYSNEWNAENLCCCKGFTRDEEIKETSMFEKAYNDAICYAKENKVCLICISHYPNESCLNNNYDKEVIYFTGHTHKNEIIIDSDKVVYADNQIGYDSNGIRFAIAKTGLCTNPYYSIRDGLYKTSIQDYLFFCRYINESVGNGNLLYQRCKNGNAELYVLKHNGFYGFFLINNGTSKGISIVNGGKTKIITNSTNINWICENFDIVLSKYLQLLLPLRKVQEQLSRELRELGFLGTVHGSIVDIDYYHHIMINPMDGRFEFYYSPRWGLVQKLYSFYDVIKSLKVHDEFCDRNYSKIKKLYESKFITSDCLLSRVSDKFILEGDAYDELKEGFELLCYVSRIDGSYGISKKISPLQRIFDKHVLREFDLRLTETKQVAYREYSYEGSRFEYDFDVYEIVKDDGTDIIWGQRVNNEQNNEIEIKRERKPFSIVDIEKKCKSNSYANVGTNWIQKKKTLLKSNNICNKN